MQVSEYRKGFFFAKGGRECVEHSIHCIYYNIYEESNVEIIWKGKALKETAWKVI